MHKVILGLLIISTITVCGQNNQTTIPQEKKFTIGYIDEIESELLDETRVLNIYLPPDYDENKAEKYPVIYLLDGSADEDFIHIVGLVQFYNFPWINKVPKSIVVGIGTVDRRRDFTFPSSVKEENKNFPTSGLSDRFMSFIETELQPYIEKKYRTKNSKTIIGQSMGGLFVTETLLKKPHLFNKYIIISPSLWWDNASLLELNSIILNASFTQETDIYIGVGKEGLTPTKTPRVMEVDANLLYEKLANSKSQSIRLTFDYLPNEDHATIMHQAVSNAFRVLY